MSLPRIEKIKQLLNTRQPDLTVLLEGVHKPHNLAAVARTCDAVGIGEIHAVSQLSVLRLSQQAAGGIKKWVKLNKYKTTEDAYKRLKEKGFSLVVTHLSEKTVDFKQIDYTKPVCVVAGAEEDGVSDYAVQHADQLISIPMTGMVQSLNVSVAMSVILFEAMRQRQDAGLYDKRRIDQRMYDQLLFEAYHPKVSQYCQQHKLEYPAIDEEGNILEEISSLAKRSIA